MRCEFPVPAMVAHRGYQKRYPENTVPAIEAALACGALFVEFDVQLTADRVPVLLHDADLLRTARVRGSVFDMTYEQVRVVEVNESRRLGHAFSGVFIPSLEEAVGTISRWPGVTAFVEIKEESLRRFGTEATVDAVMEIVRPGLGQCVPVSFDAEAMEIAKRSGAPRVGWVIRRWNAAILKEVEKLAPDFLFVNHRVLPRAAKRLEVGPWKWVVYEIDNPKKALALARRGAHMIETFTVGEMLEHPLLRRGAGYT